MSLQFQNVDVKFTQGLDTKTQPKLVIPGKWNKLENCSLCRTLTPVRRDGVTALLGSVNGTGLAEHNGQLLVSSFGGVKSVSTGGTDIAKDVAGRLGYVKVTKEEIGRSSEIQHSEDSASLAPTANYSAHVWIGSTLAGAEEGVYVTVIDEDTGTKLLDAELCRAASGGNLFCPRVVAQDNAFFIFYRDETHLWSRVVLASAPTTLGAEATLINSANFNGGGATQPYDAIASGAGGNAACYLAYVYNDGVTGIRASLVTRSGSTPGLSATANLMTAAEVTAATAIGVVAFSSTRVLVTAAATVGTHLGVAGVVTDEILNIITTTTQINATNVARSHLCGVLIPTGSLAGSIQLFFDGDFDNNATALLPIVTQSVSTALATTAGPTTVQNSATFAASSTTVPAGPRGPWIAGKPIVGSTLTTTPSVLLPVFIQENYQYLGATTANPRTLSEQNCWLLLECGDILTIGASSAVVARALYGNYGGQYVNGNYPTVSTPGTPAQLDTGIFVYAAAETNRLQLITEGTTTYNLSQTSEVRLKLDVLSITPQRVQLGESTYWSGGMMAAYDGSRVTEPAFTLFPEGIAVETIAGTMTDGVHQIVVIAEWVDGSGQRFQSAPSQAVSVTATGGNDAFRVRVPSLLLTQKTGVRFIPYVTVAGGTTFYRYGTLAAGNSGTANNTAAALTQLVDIDAVDSVIQAGELLYTQPGVAGTALPNIGPGPTTAVGVVQNRLFFDKADQPGEFGFSQRYINNTGLQFSPELGGSVPVSGGSIVGFEAMDEKAIIFCTNKPFVLFGDGPDVSGANSTYGDPQEISSDVGCNNNRSILKMPNGIIFKSPKGWQLLGRDLVVRYIGAGVAEFDDRVVTSAVLMEDRQECRFSTDSVSETGAAVTPVVLIYDYLRDQWSSTLYKFDTGAGVTEYAVRDAVFWGTSGRYVSVGVSQGLNQDTPGVYLDQPGTASAAYAIPTTARTSWLRTDIINGFQRVRQAYLTGTCSTATVTSTLTVNVSFNDAYGAVDPGYYTFSVNYGTMFPAYVAGTSVDFRHSMATQKCKSVAFEFIDTPTTANPAGVNFQSLSLQLGMKKGLRKLPGVQST